MNKFQICQFGKKKKKFLRHLHCLSFCILRNLIHKHVNHLCEFGVPSLPSYVKPIRREFLGRKIYSAANAQQ